MSADTIPVNLSRLARRIGHSAQIIYENAFAIISCVSAYLTFPCKVRALIRLDFPTLLLPI